MLTFHPFGVVFYLLFSYHQKTGPFCTMVIIHKEGAKFALS
ncbi:hypothetical protein HNO89_001280 [Sporosarcina luteola]|nr:hypothetical protein [Sporosarcina luteola]